MRYSTITRALAVFAVLSSVAVVPVAATDTASTHAQTSAASPGPPAINATLQVDPPGQNETFPTGNNSNASVNYSSGGLFSPKAFFEGGVSVLIEMGKNALKQGINYLARVISGMPAPGQPDEPMTWIDPQNGLWSGVWEAAKYTTTMGLAAVLFAGTAAFRHSDPYERRSKLQTVIFASGMILTTWLVAPFGLHIGAQISLEVAPSGSDFIASPESFVKLLSGGLLAAILVKVYLSVVVVGLFALLAQYVLIHAAVVFWPLAWGLRCFGGTLKSVGDFWLFLYGLLVGLNVTQAILLRLIFEIPWMESGLGPFLGLLATVIGLAIALIWLPKTALQTANDAASVGLGVGALNRQTTGEYVEKASDKVGDVRENYSEWRGDGDDTSASGGTTASGGVPGTDRAGVSSASVSRRRNVGSMGGGERSESSTDRSRGGMYADDDLDRERDRTSFDENRGFQ